MTWDDDLGHGYVLIPRGDFVSLPKCFPPACSNSHGLDTVTCKVSLRLLGIPPHWRSLPLIAPKIWMLLRVVVKLRGLISTDAGRHYRHEISDQH